MTKPDDSSLNPVELRAVEEHAKKLLNRAAAWGVFPTPIEEILNAAKLKVASTSIFDPRRLQAFVQEKTAQASHVIKTALSKILGLYDADESVIHIDDTLAAAKQNFLKLHEAGHHEIPTHRKIFRLFQDCEKTLDPETADEFERQANNFARFVLFQGDTYRKCAADFAFEIKTPMKLARKFGASIYASAREFVRTNDRACAVYILEPLIYLDGPGAGAPVRRIEASPSFERQFGRPKDNFISLDHPLGQVLPIGRRMMRPVSLSLVDSNGEQHECLAESFDTTWNILVLLYPTRMLASSSVVVPSGLGEIATV